MSGLFHEHVPDEYIDQVFEVICQASQHTFQILTKRAERLADYFSQRMPPTNAWLGVSVEDKAYGVPRIDCLRRVDATIRFLSAEPLLEDLGELDLTDIHWVIGGGESGNKARPISIKTTDILVAPPQRPFFFLPPVSKTKVDENYGHRTWRTD